MDIALVKTEDRGSPERDRGKDRERNRRGDRPSRFSSTTRDRSPVRDRRDRKGGDRKVFVSNVAYESKWQDIKDLFRQEVGEVTYVELFKDENEKPRGCGIVEFETAELAAKAVEKMHRFEIKGRKLVVKEDSEGERDKYGRPMGSNSNRERDQGSRSVGNSRREDTPRSNTWDGQKQLVLNPAAVAVNSAGSGNVNKFGNTYGLSVSFLESLWITGPLVSKVFVANLDYKVDEKKLREVFRLAGRVVHCEINMDKDGKSRGFGVVEYEHPVEAVQAISLLHNQMLFDRRLTVRMDRVDKVEGAPKLPEGLKGIGMGLGDNGSILNDVARNLPSNSAPMVGPNVQQQLQAVAQAQAQLAQGAQLTAALAGSNSLAPNLSNVGLLGQSINVSDLASLNPGQPFGGPSMNTSQSITSGIGTGLTGLNANMAPGLGVGGGSGMGHNFNALNNQNSLMGGNSNSFNNAGSGLHSPGSFNPARDFDSMSAALSGNNYGSYERERGRESNYNGASRGLGNGNRNMVMDPINNSNNRRDTIIVRNLPANAEHFVQKCSDIGKVARMDRLSRDSAAFQFTSGWDAERAVRELDRTRFDGRTIDVTLY